MNAFRYIPGYEHHIYEAGKEALLLVYLAFLISFAMARLYTRLARIHGWGSGSLNGVHIHHAVPGTVLVLVSALLAFTPWGQTSPSQEVLAIMFGTGAGLVLDEWALIFYMGDVYWSKEGRSSIDAVIVGTVVTGLLLVSTSPLGVEDRDYSTWRVIVFTTIIVHYVFSLICFLKGKPIFGAIGLLIPFVAVIGALRLAKPGSPWARWWYTSTRGPAALAHRRAHKLERSRHRYLEGWHGRAERRAMDVIGGAPSPPPREEPETPGAPSAG